MEQPPDFPKQLVEAILRGDSQLARDKALQVSYSTKNPRQALENILEAFNIVRDLRKMGEYDEPRTSSCVQAITASLSAIEPLLASKGVKLTGRVSVGATVSSPDNIVIGITAAMLRTLGLMVTDFSRCQTPLELLRNAEQAGADLLVANLPGEEPATQLVALADVVVAGGFSQRFDIIAMVPESAVVFQPSPVIRAVARGSLEAVSKVTELVMKKRQV